MNQPAFIKPTANSPSGVSVPVIVNGENYNGKIQWLTSNAQSGGCYVIEFDAGESVGSTTFSYGGREDITVVLVGIGSKRIISLNENGSMFCVGLGVTLILGDNLELRGRSSNSAALIYVNPGAHLIMNGGEISGNYSSFRGGGVFVLDGTFTMNGGKISGNSSYGSGSGVYVSGGTFIMNGGKISENSSGFSGGAVFVWGTFAMGGGKISGNTASVRGGGVYSSDVFIMNGGEIYGNSSSGPGGGVYVAGGTFTMDGGKVSGNSSTGSGGGVYVEGGEYVWAAFTMEGGEITGNTAGAPGGGVYVDGSVFKKTGGIISGYSEGDPGSNVVKDSSGAVRQNQGQAVHVNSGNSGYIMGRDAGSGPEDNLSFDGTFNPPRWGGGWNY